MDFYRFQRNVKFLDRNLIYSKKRPRINPWYNVRLNNE